MLLQLREELHYSSSTSNTSCFHVCCDGDRVQSAQIDAQSAHGGEPTMAVVAGTANYKIVVAGYALFCHSSYLFGSIWKRNDGWLGVSMEAGVALLGAAEVVARD